MRPPDLTLRQQEILRLRYLGDREGRIYSLVQVAKELRSTATRIGFEEARAVQKIVRAVLNCRGG